MSQHVRTCLIRYALALLSGVALSFAYAPTNWGFIAWFFPAALLGLIWSIPQDKGNWRKNWGRGFRLAFVAGFGFWVRDASFIGEVSAIGKWFIAGAAALYLSLFFAVYGGWAATLGRWKIEAWGETPEERKQRPKPQYAIQILGLSVLHGFLWCGLEWLRGVGRLSLGWDGLGVSFIDAGYVMAQSADIFGVNALSFMLVMGAAVFLQTAKTFHLEAKNGYRRAHWEVGLTLGILCLNFLYGTYRVTQVQKAESIPVRTLLIQENIALEHFQSMSDYAIDQYTPALEAAFNEIEEQSVATLQETGAVKLKLPDIVMLPENALNYPIWLDGRGEVVTREWMQGVGIEWEQEVPTAVKVEDFYTKVTEKYPDFLYIAGVTEYPMYTDEEGLVYIDQYGNPKADWNKSFYNSVGFISGDFSNIERRQKNHLMPFGEYIPVEGVFKHLFNLFSGQEYVGSFDAGTNYEPYQTELQGLELSVIPVVCYEDTVSRIVRKYVRHEPQIMVNVTNDGWFAGTSCGEKHFENARFRAIEYRRPLIRTANTGLSGVIQATGSNLHPVTGALQELRDKSGNYEVSGSLQAVAMVPKEPILTIYSVIGDVFCWGGGLIVLIWSGFQIALRRRSSAE